MRLARPIYFPFIGLLVGTMLLLIAVLAVLIGLAIVDVAYAKLGLNPHLMVALLAFSVLGSAINIPVYYLRAERVLSDQVVSVFGISYVVPLVEEWPGTLIAVNLGGAIIPLGLSLYLLAHHGFWIPALEATGVTTGVVYLVARPTPGVGIVVPIFVPPLLAAGIAAVLDRPDAPALAYVSGVLGTLLGGDLLNLWRVRGLSAPIASIGGAGTFDGIFVTGILAVLLA